LRAHFLQSTALFENISQGKLTITINKNDLNRKGQTFQKNIKPYEHTDISMERIFCKEIIKEDDQYIISIFEINN
jgi:hypothetical protein